MRANPQHRYEELASFIMKLVDDGALPPGSRVPSLRQISRQQQISLSTALQAYRLLEDRGVLEAKPQSGFYIARARSMPLESPRCSNPPAKATNVAVSDLVLEFVEHAADPRFVPLGVALPSPDLLAGRQLNRFLARATRMRGQDDNSYTVARGSLKLRQEIARRAMRWGQGLAPDDIVITFGCTEALALGLKSVTRPGDTVATESPTYFGLFQAIEALGLKALELPTASNTGVDLVALEKALNGNTIKACLFSSSFSNPLGSTMPEGKKLAVVDLLAKHGVPLIEDDIFGEIYFGTERPKPFMALDRHGNTIYCSSFSKTVAPGYRIGWIATHRHLQTIIKNKVASTLCGPALPQAAMAEYLSSGGYDSHLRRIRRIFEDNIQRMSSVIDEVFPNGTRISRPVGGFVLWLELPKGIESRELFDQALAQGICFAPGDVFSASGRYGNCLRLSCAHYWDERIETSVRTLGRMVSEALIRQ